MVTVTEEGNTKCPKFEATLKGMSAADQADLEGDIADYTDGWQIETVLTMDTLWHAATDNPGEGAGEMSYAYGVGLEEDACPNGAWALGMDWSSATGTTVIAPTFGFLASGDYESDDGLASNDSSITAYILASADEEEIWNYEADPTVTALDTDTYVLDFEYTQSFYMPKPLVAPADTADGSTGDDGDRLDQGTFLMAMSSEALATAVDEECADESDGAEITGAATLAAAGTAALALALSI